jgi:tetratricopeptide (TPR) repeat protein
MGTYRGRHHAGGKFPLRDENPAAGLPVRDYNKITAERWQQVKELFQSALEREPSQLEPNKLILESVYWRLAAVYGKKSIYAEAIANYQESLNLSGDSDPAALGRRTKVWAS